MKGGESVQTASRESNTFKVNKHTGRVSIRLIDGGQSSESWSLMETKQISIHLMDAGCIAGTSNEEFLS